jgi:hypothetical protein
LLSRQRILHLGKQLGKIGRVAREKAGLQATYDLRMLVPAATGADLTATRCVPARKPDASRQAVATVE